MQTDFYEHSSNKNNECGHEVLEIYSSTVHNIKHTEGCWIEQAVVDLSDAM